MKKRTKVLLIALCAVALIAGSAAGAIAYLTDNEAVTNTFTVGNVEISLAETDVDNDGKDYANAYHLIPGESYVKDPKVTVLEGSESAYIRMLVTVSDMEALKAAFPDAEYYDGEVFLLEKLVNWDSANWDCVGYKNGTYEFRYVEPVAAPAADVVLPALFSKITIPGEITNAELANLQNLEITVVAHAIQAAGFDSADAAWAAFAS